MINSDVLADISEAARAAAQAEIEQILTTPQANRAHVKGKAIRIEEVRDALEDYASGIVLPRQLAYLMYRPGSTLDEPVYWHALRVANLLSRAEAAQCDYENELECQEFSEELLLVGTVVV